MPRFVVQVVGNDRVKLGIPAMIHAEHIDAALKQFIADDAGHWLQRGYTLEVTDEQGKKLNFLFSDSGPKWIPSL